MSLYIPGSAGERFGTVLLTRQAGEFVMRLSRYAAGLRIPIHHHPRAYFSFVVRGGLDEWSPRGDAHFEPGSVHFHAPLDPHSGHTGGAGMTTLSIVPQGSIAARLAGRRERRADPPTHEMRWFAARCYRALREQDDAGALCTQAAALELVATTLRDVESESLRRRPRWLNAVRDHLERHFPERVRIHELAEIADVHEVYLVRGFRRHMGVTPGAFLRRLRVEAARLQLTVTRRPIADIALATGFSSQAHLTRVFHRELGLPPAVYRRRHGRA